LDDGIIAVYANLPEATYFFRKLRGGSQPILVQASDKCFYVAKLPTNPQGPNLLFNEGAGSELFRACDLPVPIWKPILITKSFLEHNPGCWPSPQADADPPRGGVCFASKFLGTGNRRTLDILPQSSHARITDRSNFWLAWLVDIYANHADNRQALFSEGDNGDLTTTFFDFGHMFGGPEGGDQPAPPASRYLDWRIYPDLSADRIDALASAVRNLNSDRLWLKVQDLPDEWKSVSALRAFNNALHCLCSRLIMQDILEAIVDDISVKKTRGEQQRIHAARPPHTVLHAGVRAVA
jgi:hypothetical protein